MHLLKKGWSACMVAALLNDADLICRLIHEGGDNPDFVNERGESALIVASGLGHADCVQALVHGKADVNLVSKNGCTPIALCAQKGHVSALRHLKEAHLNAQVQGAPPIMWSIQTRHDDCVEALLDMGADVEVRDMYGTTPLVEACIFGNANVVRMLLERGADADNPSLKGLTALMHCVQREHLKCTQILIDAKADLDAQEPTQKTTALMFSLTRDPAFATRLVQAGADLEARDSLGGTVLNQAAHVGVNVQLLLDAKASVHTTDDGGWTPLLRAAYRRHVDVVHALVRAGADVEHVELSGANALILALRNEHLDVASALVECGANVDAVTPTGMSPLFACCSNGFGRGVRFLVDHGSEAAKTLVETGAVTIGNRMLGRVERKEGMDDEALVAEWLQQQPSEPSHAKADSEPPHAKAARELLEEEEEEKKQAASSSSRGRRSKNSKERARAEERRRRVEQERERKKEDALRKEQETAARTADEAIRNAIRRADDAWKAGERKDAKRRLSTAAERHFPHASASAKDELRAKREGFLSVEREERKKAATPPPAEKKEDDKECVVCLDEEASHACSPCGHVCLCASCVALVKEKTTCPKCRANVDHFLRLYY